VELPWVLVSVAGPRVARRRTRSALAKDFRRRACLLGARRGGRGLFLDEGAAEGCMVLQGGRVQLRCSFGVFHESEKGDAGNRCVEYFDGGGGG